MADVPIACTLDGDELVARRSQLLPGLISRADQASVLPDGYRFRFAANSDVLNAIVQVVDAERQCCRFLTFELVVSPDNGPIWLAVTGPDPTREFLSSLLVRGILVE